MDLGHFETAGGIELTKIAERGDAPTTTSRGAGQAGSGRRAAPRQAIIIATPVNLVPVAATTQQLSGTCAHHDQ
jgi:hypothetical protein